MPTKTFSGRVEAFKLGVVEEVVRQRKGMSFGQYCSSELVDFIFDTGELPETTPPKDPREGIAFMKTLTEKHGITAVSSMSDDEIRNLIAERYEG